MLAIFSLHLVTKDGGCCLPLRLMLRFVSILCVTAAKFLLGALMVLHFEYLVPAIRVDNLSARIDQIIHRWLVQIIFLLDLQIIEIFIQFL